MFFFFYIWPSLSADLIHSELKATELEAKNGSRWHVHDKNIGKANTLMHLNCNLPWHWCMYCVCRGNNKDSISKSVFLCRYTSRLNLTAHFCRLENIDGCLNSFLIDKKISATNQGDQMSLWKSYPNCSPTQFWSKLMHDSYLRKKVPQHFGLLFYFWKKLPVSNSLGEFSPNLVTLLPMHCYVC
jgi:hypothetical protein